MLGDLFLWLVANLKQGVIYFIKQACGNDILASVYVYDSMITENDSLLDNSNIMFGFCSIFTSFCYKQQIHLTIHFLQAYQKHNNCLQFQKCPILRISKPPSKNSSLQGLLEFIWTEGCSGRSSNPGPASTLCDISKIQLR